MPPSRPSRPRVLLDPDGAWPRPWTFVIVHAPTGVWYAHQYGVTAIRQAHTDPSNSTTAAWPSSTGHGSRS